MEVSNFKINKKCKAYFYKSYNIGRGKIIKVGDYYTYYEFGDHLCRVCKVLYIFRNISPVFDTVYTLVISNRKFETGSYLCTDCPFTPRGMCNKNPYLGCINIKILVKKLPRLRGLLLLGV